VLPTNANSAGGDGGARQACLEPSKSANHNSLPSPAGQAAPKRHDATARAVLDFLCEQFPKCFVHYEARRRPLKLGIHLNLIAALAGAVMPHELSRALRFYVSNKVYRSRLQAGAPRINLNGELAGIVTPEQAVVPAKRPAPNPKPIPQAAPETTAPMLPPTKRLSLADLRAAGERRKVGAPPQDGGRR
jgi:hypothetical protein